MKQVTCRRRFQWLKNINRADMMDMSSNTLRHVCAHHFLSGTSMWYNCIEPILNYHLHVILGTPSYVIKENDIDWAPKQNMGHDRNLVDSPATTLAKTERNMRLIKRRARLNQSDIKSALESQESLSDLDDGNNISDEMCDDSRYYIKLKPLSI